MNRRQLTIVIAAVFSTVATVVSADIAGGIPLDPRCAAVEAAFQEAKTTGDLPRVKEELAKLYREPSQDTKLRALEWVGRHDRDLTAAQYDELVMLFVEINPNDTGSKGIRASIARRHFTAAPQEVRVKYYWQAVKTGEAVFEEWFVMDRVLALGLASNEGLEEFAPLVDQYESEIDKSWVAPAMKNSAWMRWRFRLRRGAKNEGDGRRLQAERLLEMPDEQFADLMANDQAFLEMTLALFSVCDEPLSEACKSLAKLAARQECRYQEQYRALPQEAKSLTGPFGPNWLQGLVSRTEAARSQLAREHKEVAPHQP